MDPVNGVLDASPASPAEALPDFGSYSSSDWASFQKTGELPSEKPAEPSKTDATPEPGQDATGKSGAASDAAEKPQNTQEPQRPNREERRNQRLNNENRELKARLEALEKAQTKPQETKSATTETKIPKLKDYATTEEWEDAKDAWHADNTSKAVREALRIERESQQKADRETSQKTETEKTQQAFAKRLADHKKTLKDDTFAEDFTDVKSAIDKSGALHLADALVESDYGPQLITYFGEHPEEFEALCEMSPNAALRELGRLEVSDKIKGPAPKTRTAAKKIGSGVRGSAAVTDEDEQLEEAVRTGNQVAYNQIMAKREAAENRR